MSEKDKEAAKDEKSQKEETKEKTEDVSSKIPTLIKKGDYTVHILIEQIKNAVCKNKDMLPSPCVKMTCFSKSQRTAKLKNNCSDNIYNEHFYFDQTDLSVSQLDKEKILIEVYDYNNSSKEDYLGIYEFDIQYVYNFPNHTMKNTWIALANPKAEDITKINGYLKLSISVLNDNDPRIELTPSIDDNSDNCLIPSQIKLRYKEISIQIFKGDGISDEDDATKRVGKKCEGFVEVSYMGTKLKTEVVDMVNDLIEWNTTINLGITIPAVSKTIEFAIKDKDLMKENYLGAFSFSVEDILNDRYPTFFYANVYGGCGNSHNEYYKEMNTNSVLGSKWKGRVLMKITVLETDKPYNSVVKMDPKKDANLIQLAGLTRRPNLWTFYCKVLDVYYLPFKDESYSIRIEADLECSRLFSKKKAINRNLSLQEGTNVQVYTCNKNIEEVNDIFIYLEKEGKRICFQRIKAKYLLNNTNTMIVKLIPEPSVGIVKDTQMTGLVKLKLRLVNGVLPQNEAKEYSTTTSSLPQNENPNDLSYDPDDLEAAMAHEEKHKNDINYENIDDRTAVGLQTFNKTENYNSKGEKINTFYTVLVNVYMTRHLISGDADGTSDPYVSIMLEDQEERTKVKHNCVNGIWNQSLKFDNINFSLDDKSTWPIFFLKVMDEDVLSDDFLCYNYIWLSDMAYQINDTSTLLKPRWHQLLLSKSNKRLGQILLSAFIIDTPHLALAENPTLLPETVNYSFEINILGMRDLQPLSIIPVKKAFVSFDLNSINYKDQSELQPIKTEPKDSGSNPNITSIIKFNAMLPKDLTFLPNLQCEVFDYILSGIIKQNLGIFELDIVKIIKETVEGINKDMKISQNRVNMFLMEGIQKKREYDSKGGFSATSQEQFQMDLKAPLVENENKDSIVEVDDNDNKLDNNYLVQNQSDLCTFNVKPIDEDDINANLYNSNYFILKPVFKLYSIPGIPKTSKDYRTYYLEDEMNNPDDTLYFPLGYNKYSSSIDENGDKISNTGVETQNKRHYRRIFNTELENVKQLGLASPFIKCQILREKYSDEANKKGQFLESMYNQNINSKVLKVYKNGEESTERKDSEEHNALIDDNTNDSKSYGEFKAVARICETTLLNEYKKKVNKIKEKEPYLISEMKHFKKYDTISKKILTKTSVVLRLYILKLCDLAKKDAFSESDPYITISLGNKKDIVNEKKNHINDKSTVDWYKTYDIPTELPGNGILEISVYDYDPLFSDELIGSTKIDIEDRFFDNEWNSLKFKPIERRNLYHPDFKKKQGDIIMFLEIFNKSDRFMLEPWNIQPEPQTKVECRLIIYETEDIACMDVEDTSDIYVMAYLDNDKHQSTDIHYRCQTGVGSFNWRMIFDVDMPRDKYLMNFLVYDNDILMRDDFICGNTMNIRRLLRDCNVLDMPIKFTRDYLRDLPEKERDSNIEFLAPDEDKEGIKFWVQMYKNEAKAGRVLCSLEVLPMWKAKSCPVGKGRDEPNVNPYLPPPVGRISFSLNPLTMVNQLVGPKFRKKMYTTLIMCCLITYCIIIVPFAIYYVAGELVNPFNYIKK